MLKLIHGIVYPIDMLPNRTDVWFVGCTSLDYKYQKTEDGIYKKYIGDEDSTGEWVFIQYDITDSFLLFPSVYDNGSDVEAEHVG